MRYFPKVP